MGALIFIALALTLCCFVSAQQQKPGDVWKDPVLGMEFVWVPGGCYEMGCGSWASACSDHEKPVHTVCVSGFWMGRYEVTQGQWKRIMGANPATFYRCGDDCPMENVPMVFVLEFVKKLSQKAGHEFGLPTEAEWEYACRSGGWKDQYSGGDNADAVAWHEGNSGGLTHPVGQKRPNRLGIYDMSGNVWEWCMECYDPTYYSSSPRDNPVSTCPSREKEYRFLNDAVIRGGSFDHTPIAARCTHRWSWSPGWGAAKGAVIGFRLVRVPNK